MSVPPPEPTRACPHCGRAISPTIAICPICGRSVAAGAVWPPAPTNHPQVRLGPARPILGGIVASNAAAALLVLLNFGVGYALGNTGVTLNSAIVAIDPIFLCLAMGLVSAFFWRALELSGWRRFGYSLLNTAVGLLVAAVFLREGVICLVMVAPLAAVVVWLGSVMGDAIFRRGGNRLQSSLVPGMILLVLGDGAARHDFRGCVTDTVIVRARPAQIWPYLAGFPPIPEGRSSGYWLFALGLPHPVQSVSTGARRQCIFNGPAVLEERITERLPNRRLTFAVIRQPAQPEIFTHIRLKRGQFILRDNGDGTTTLIGRSWYQLPIHPVWYYNPWARDVIRRVHLRVMRHIKTLAEKDAAAVK